VVLREDRGFLASRAEFVAWASGKKELRMEWFYRQMRRKHGILMVEFANDLQVRERVDRRTAIEHAARVRLRPILMTTAAMVVGRC
jgi:hypothetical protein